MPHDSGGPAARRPADRLDDHAAIDRLADELLPALVAKLGASGLGELEVREGTWRMRLRMPADLHVAAGRHPAPGRGGARAADGLHGEHPRPDAAATAGIGHASTHASTAETGSAPGGVATGGTSRSFATSPAVGYFRPRADLPAGTEVRAGDPIAHVDVLGIGQELVAPCDGLIGATLVAAGEPVEYGQAIIVLEPLAEPRPNPAAAMADEGPVERGAAAGRVAGDTTAAERVPARHDGAARHGGHARHGRAPAAGGA